MAFERVAENRVREAIREGRFDGLPVRGKPIDHFKLPDHLRMAIAPERARRA